MNQRVLLSAIALCVLLTGCTKEAAPRSAEQSPSVPAAASSAVPQSAVSSALAVPGRSPLPEPLKSVLARYTARQVVSFQSFSLGDHQTAAFALVEGGVEGNEVWYVTSSGAQKLKTGIRFYENQPDNDKPFLWTVDGVRIFKCSSSPGGSSSTSYAWYVKDGKPVELPYTGMRLSYLGDGQFTTIGEAFDMVFENGKEAGGHTYKIYYLYWAGDGLREYGGLKITRQQLLKAKGAKAVLDAIIQSGHTVDGIYYRADNIINVNYHSGDQKNGNFDNVTLVYQNGAVIPKSVNPEAGGSGTETLTAGNLGDFSYGGIYRAAFFPKIATYPDRFPTY